MQSSVETFSELQIHNVTMNMVKNISKKPIKSKIELPTRKTRMSQTRNTFLNGWAYWNMVSYHFLPRIYVDPDRIGNTSIETH